MGREGSGGISVTAKRAADVDARRSACAMRWDSSTIGGTGGAVPGGRGAVDVAGGESFSLFLFRLFCCVGYM